MPQFIQTASPWGEAAQMGEGMGNSFANVMFQLPQIRQQQEFQQEQMRLQNEQMALERLRMALESGLQGKRGNLLDAQTKAVGFQNERNTAAAERDRSFVAKNTAADVLQQHIGELASQSGLAAGRGVLARNPIAPVQGLPPVTGNQTGFASDTPQNRAMIELAMQAMLQNEIAGLQGRPQLGAQAQQTAEITSGANMAQSPLAAQMFQSRQQPMQSLGQGQQMFNMMSPTPGTPIASVAPREVSDMAATVLSALFGPGYENWMLENATNEVAGRTTQSLANQKVQEMLKRGLPTTPGTNAPAKKGIKYVGTVTK